MHTNVSYYVNSLTDDHSSVCHLFGCSACTAPVKVSRDTTVTLSGANIYTVRRDDLAASVMINDTETQSQDYSLVLMLDPQANHSFVYYATSINFVGDYLQSVHSNDESFLAVTALAEDTVIRIAPSQTVYINDVIALNNSIIIIPVIQSVHAANITHTAISYGEEYKIALNLGETWMISSREDITGTRVTANKAVSFYSGHHCASGKSTNCALLTEQIPPYNSWGNSFALHTNISGLKGNMFKIIASDAGANVYMNCTSEGDSYEISNFNLGFRQHIVIPVNHDYCTVNSDKNILMLQFKDSSGLIQDTFMTIIPALNHFQTRYVFNTYPSFDSYAVITLKNTDPNTDSLLLNKSPVTLKWKSIEISGDIYYYGTLSLSAKRHALEFSKNNIKFGAVIYGVGENNVDTYALPAGLALHVKNDLPFQGTFIHIHTYVHTYIHMYINIDNMV